MLSPFIAEQFARRSVIGCVYRFERVVFVAQSPRRRGQREHRVTSRVGFASLLDGTEGGLMYSGGQTKQLKLAEADEGCHFLGYRKTLLLEVDLWVSICDPKRIECSTCAIAIAISLSRAEIDTDICSVATSWHCVLPMESGCRRC